jgi:hypothetical protein
MICLRWWLWEYETKCLQPLTHLSLAWALVGSSYASFCEAYGIHLGSHDAVEALGDSSSK